MIRLYVTLSFFVILFGVINCQESYVNCSSYVKCVAISSCRHLSSLVYNFTLLSDEDRRLALQSIQCGGTESDPSICCEGCGSVAVTNKILGGNITLLEEYPWMAALEYKHHNSWTRISCGGSLINQRYVLTAAHCLTENSVKVLYQVILGEYHLHNITDCVGETCTNAFHIDIEKIIIHPDYNNVTHANDIGLIRLMNNVQFTDYIKPICLPSSVNMEASTDGECLEICGWGENEQSRSVIKTKLSVPLYNHTACNKKYRQYNISDTQLCAGGLRKQDACRGDSGGPLMKTVRKWYAIEGILSFGVTACATEGWPSIYTRVSSFEAWIRENVRP